MVLKQVVESECYVFVPRLYFHFTMGKSTTGDLLPTVESSLEDSFMENK